MILTDKELSEYLEQLNDEEIQEEILQEEMLREEQERDRLCEELNMQNYDFEYGDVKY